MNPPTDEELVRQIRSGDLSAQRQLISRWEESVFRIAWRVLGNQADAEEVRQAVFLRLIEKTQSLPEVQQFGGWIRRCIVNAAVSFIRRETVRASSRLPLDLSDSAASPERAAIDTEEAVRLREALDTLPPEDRALLALRFDEGLSFSEIADALDRPASTVKSQYARLIARLKTLLDETTQEVDRHV